MYGNYTKLDLTLWKDSKVSNRNYAEDYGSVSESIADLTGAPYKTHKLSGDGALSFAFDVIKEADLKGWCISCVPQNAGDGND